MYNRATIEELVHGSHYAVRDSRRAEITVALTMLLGEANFSCELPVSASVNVWLQRSTTRGLTRLYVTVPAHDEQTDTTTFLDRRVRWITQDEGSVRTLVVRIDDETNTARDEIWGMFLESSTISTQFLAGDYATILSVEADPQVTVTTPDLRGTSGSELELRGHAFRNRLPASIHRGNRSTLMMRWSQTGGPISAEPGDTVITPFETRDAQDFPPGWQAAAPLRLPGADRPVDLIYTLEYQQHEFHGSQDAQVRLSHPPLISWGNEGDGPGQFKQLTRIAVHGDRVATVEINRRVQVFDLEGNLLFGFRSWNGGEFVDLFGGVAFDSDGLLHVCGCRFVHRFRLSDSGAEHVADVRLPGAHATWIVVDSNGTSFATKEPRFFYKFSANGEILDRAGGMPFAVDTQGMLYVMQRSPAISMLNDKLEIVDEFPVEVWGRAALGPDGTIYVLDSATSRVLQYEQGVKVFEWGGEEELFAHPQDIATDELGKVYVADSGNHRIRKFGPS